MKKKCLCTTWGIKGENTAHNGCPVHAIKREEYIPASAQGERCYCGEPAVARVVEQIFVDDPNPFRHPFTAYVCRRHFNEIMNIKEKQQ